MSEEYTRAAKARGLTSAVLERMRTRLHLIEVAPTRIDYLCSALKKRGFDVRQWLDLDE